ncbi:MAG: hypothetical protein JSV85_05040, partial [Candidatus Bathyarchaeota archaeon]
RNSFYDNAPYCLLVRMFFDVRIVNRGVERMRRIVGLLAVLMFLSTVLSVLPASAGVPFCWFNKHIYVDGSWMVAPTQVTVPLGVDWSALIGITVSAPVTIENVVVTDRFGAEIEIVDPFPFVITHGNVSYETKGKSEKVFLTWNIGMLAEGETAILIFEISTDLNPAGKQEYTSPGCYELNSGAVLKFTYNGIKYSAYTLPITVLVVD